MVAIRIARLVLFASALAPAALAQDRPAAAPTRGEIVRDEAMEGEDAVAIRAAVTDEAAHRERLARLRRLRALAAERGLADRLARIDQLERLEITAHMQRRQSRARQMNAESWAATERFLQRRDGSWLRIDREQGRQARASRAGREGSRFPQRAEPSRTGTRTPTRTPARTTPRAPRGGRS